MHGIKRNVPNLLNVSMLQSNEEKKSFIKSPSRFTSSINFMCQRFFQALIGTTIDNKRFLVYVDEYTSVKLVHFSCLFQKKIKSHQTTKRISRCKKLFSLLSLFVRTTVNTHTANFKYFSWTAYNPCNVHVKQSKKKTNFTSAELSKKKFFFFEKVLLYIKRMQHIKNQSIEKNQTNTSRKVFVMRCVIKCCRLVADIPFTPAFPEDLTMRIYLFMFL